MPNENYRKIINLGKWLESYLKPSLKPHDYRGLAAQAINLLDIDYRLTDDDRILENIKVFENLSIGDQEEFLSLGNTPSGAHFSFKNSKFRSLFTFYGNWSLENFFSIYYLRRILLNLFQIIIKQKTPWAHTLDRYREDKKIVLDIQWLKALYSELVESLVILKGRAIVQKTFQIPSYGEFETNVGYDGANGTLHTPSCLPWKFIIPRVFFDFLLAGGQEYFGFCKYCGNFMAVERKGRKKFCSDICRTANQHK